MNNADRMRAEPDDNVIDLENLFTCEKCREKYGECSEDTRDCESRFLEFCEEEAP